MSLIDRVRARKIKFDCLSACFNGSHRDAREVVSECVDVLQRGELRGPHDAHDEKLTLAEALDDLAHILSPVGWLLRWDAEGVGHGEARRVFEEGLDVSAHREV